MKIINNNSNKYIIYNILLVQEEAQLSQRGSATLRVAASVRQLSFFLY